MGSVSHSLLLGLPTLKLSFMLAQSSLCLCFLCLGTENFFFFSVSSAVNWKTKCYCLNLPRVFLSAWLTILLEHKTFRMIVSKHKPDHITCLFKINFWMRHQSLNCISYPFSTASVITVLFGLWAAVTPALFQQKAHVASRVLWHLAFLQFEELPSPVPVCLLTAQLESLSHGNLSWLTGLSQSRSVSFVTSCFSRNIFLICIHIFVCIIFLPVDYESSHIEHTA
jgi:hypothetical protein